MNYHIVKKNSEATAGFFHKCKLFDRDFRSFYNLREHKRKEHGTQRGSGAEDVDVAHVKGYVDDNSLKEELKMCKHFSTDSEMEKRRHRVYNFAMATLDAKKQLEKVDVVIGNLKCAARLNVAFGFVLKNVEDASRWY